MQLKVGRKSILYFYQLIRHFFIGHIFYNNKRLRFPIRCRWLRKRPNAVAYKIVFFSTMSPEYNISFNWTPNWWSTLFLSNLYLPLITYSNEKSRKIAQLLIRMFLNWNWSKTNSAAPRKRLQWTNLPNKISNRKYTIVFLKESKLIDETLRPLPKTIETIFTIRWIFRIFCIFFWLINLSFVCPNHATF